MTATDYENATVAVIACPNDATKPWLEWARNDKPGPVEGVLGIHAGRKFDVYRVEIADVPAGRGFRFVKLTSDDAHAYVCSVSSGGAVLGGCECWSGLRNGTCRHQKAAAALLARKMV